MEEVLMLKRVAIGLVGFAAIAIAYQALMGLVFTETQPYWDTGIVVLLSAIGALHGYQRYRREYKKREPLDAP